jgi:hypothetical protein
LFSKKRNVFFVCTEAIILAKQTKVMKKIYSLLLFAILFSACQQGEKKMYVIKNIDLIAEGPLFDGPNTMQAKHIIDLNQIESGLDASKLEAVKLVRAEVSTKDSSGFDLIRNFVLQLTSSDAKMEKVAVLNPVEKGNKKVNLNPASEGELLDNFQQKEIILILDADLIGDKDENLTYQGDFEFEITYKK